ncbi:MAG: flagellar protein FlgN [Treponema sp.]|jgi:DNA repair exonuclease SbcCD ATPase subunit|nr:flagellar protein FlgN [Treponema sp.]
MAAAKKRTGGLESTEPSRGRDLFPQGELPPEELRQRVAILKRFRELLQDQRDRFRSYLEVLDKQKDVIEQGDTEALMRHVELEEKIVADIFSIQRVINPLEDMYRAVYSAKGEASPETAEVPSLKAALEDLKTEAIARSERNKELLLKRMTELRSEIKTLRGNPFARKTSIYAGAGTASLIDIQG